MPLQSDSIINRWVDNSPRAGEILRFRAQKDIEEKQKTRKALEKARSLRKMKEYEAQQLLIE